MRLLRLHFTVAILILGLSAVTSFGEPVIASKKKAKSTRSSKTTRETARSKSKKPQKQTPTQAKNTRPRTTTAPATGNQQVVADTRASSQAALDASTRKGKKGFSTASSSTVAQQPVAPTTPHVNLQKPAAVTVPISRVSTVASGQGALSTNQPGTESSLPPRPASPTIDDVQPSSSVPVLPAPNQTTGQTATQTGQNGQPDRIDVVEYREAQKSTSGARSSSPPTSRIFGISSRRIDVDIDTPRVMQIQKALKDRGFYQLEPNGVYDEDTINAMKAFQQNERIDITGYPTAHALKRLGLN